ncbi:hypothetical protein HDV05_000149 [Chytridiales sp. JEL 0842]|nr:hypothetical protein HDV05_000149 [Chytridiales sp. JEL 0842]
MYSARVEQIRQDWNRSLQVEDEEINEFALLEGKVEEELRNPAPSGNYRVIRPGKKPEESSGRKALLKDWSISLSDDDVLDDADHDVHCLLNVHSKPDPRSKLTSSDGSQIKSQLFNISSGKRGGDDVETKSTLLDSVDAGRQEPLIDLHQIIRDLEKEIAGLRRRESEWKDSELRLQQLANQARDTEVGLRSKNEQLQEELRKTKREKILLEKNKRATDFLPNKRERHEIELLRQQIADLNENFKKTELRNNLQVERLKTRINQLTLRNDELSEDVRVLEEERALLIHQAQLQIPPPKHDRSTSPIPVTVDFPTVIHQKPSKLKLDTNNNTARQALDSLQHMLELDLCLSEKELPDGKILRTYDHGITLCWYRNGTIKHKSGKVVKIYFENGDYKEVLNRSLQFFSE